MHTIRGSIQRAEYVNNAGIAQLSLTVRQCGARRYTSQPIEALMAYGRGDTAHAAARRAANTIVLGGVYRINGTGLAAAGGQVWLLGVEEWGLMAPPPDSLEPAVPSSLAQMREQLLNPMHSVVAAC